MKKILYFDLISGISGDMAVGALLDMLTETEVQRYKDELKKLNLDKEFDINIYKDSKKGIFGTKFDVILNNEQILRDLKHEHKHHEHSHDHDDHTHEHDHTHSHNDTTEHVHGRTFFDIQEIIDSSDLTVRTKEYAKNIFVEIAIAESKIHNVSIEDVHFHEVGAVDSIVDIVSTAIIIDILDISDIRADKIRLGSGFVECEHGMMPVPAPATLEILRGLPTIFTNIECELVTPTGAGILKALITEFDSRPNMKVEKVGYGVGTMDLEAPNLLRVYIAQIEDDEDSEELILFQTNIDDMSSEIYSYLFEMLFSIGVLDVYTTNIGMKKNRPGISLNVLANKEIEFQVEEILFRETSTFGIRKQKITRVTLQRSIKRIQTAYGEVAIKLGYYKGEIIKITPEYEDVKNIANRHCVPFFEVYNDALVKIKEQNLWQQF